MLIEDAEVSFNISDNMDQVWSMKPTNFIWHSNDDQQFLPRKDRFGVVP